MKKMFEEMNYNTDDVKELVHSTYYMQRKYINKGAGIKKLSREWPFLFREAGMAAHFQELTGLSLMETFLANVDKKEKCFLNFLKSVDAQKHKQVLDALIKFQNERVQADGWYRWYFFY